MRIKWAYVDNALGQGLAQSKGYALYHYYILIVLWAPQSYRRVSEFPGLGLCGPASL